MSVTTSPNLKKRRRTVKCDDEHQNVSSQTSTESKRTRGDLIKSFDKSYYNEETDAMNRSASNDVVICDRTCSEIERLFTEIYRLKMEHLSEGGEGGDIHTPISEAETQISLLFITLKKLNRMSHIRCKKSKDGTQDAKQKTDGLFLQLQNLLYEVMHVQKEISKCLDFKSADDEIDLVPIEEFYENAPEGVSEPRVTKKDPHQQMLARLSWETSQRKQLKLKCSQAEKFKESLVQGIEEKKQSLDQLLPQLNVILDSTKQLQDNLDMPLDKTRHQHQLAAHLPRPLYILYYQTTAYADTVTSSTSSSNTPSNVSKNRSMTVTVEGEIEQAKDYTTTDRTLCGDDDSHSESELDETSEEPARRRRTTSTHAEVNTDKVFNRHPLSIKMVLRFKTAGELQLLFYYYTQFNVVTVESTLNTDMKFSDAALLSSGVLLSCLFPGDTGDTSPNPTNHFLLKRHGLNKFKHYLDTTGRPYVWVQGLCGLRFLEKGPSAARPNMETSENQVGDVIKEIRLRVTCRMTLLRQLDELERLSLPSLPTGVVLHPGKVSATLTRWVSISEEYARSLPYVFHVCQSDLVGAMCTFYTGVFERGSAKLSFCAVLPPDYPTNPPTFAIKVSHGGSYDFTNSENLRSIEAFVNSCSETEPLSKSVRNYTLTIQLHKLVSRFELFLEACSVSMAPAEFPRDKIISRELKGRLRTCPLVYNSCVNVFVHDQK